MIRIISLIFVILLIKGCAVLSIDKGYSLDSNEIDIKNKDGYNTDYINIFSSFYDYFSLIGPPLIPIIPIFGTNNEDIYINIYI